MKQCTGLRGESSYQVDAEKRHRIEANPVTAYIMTLCTCTGGGQWREAERIKLSEHVSLFGSAGNIEIKNIYAAGKKQ